MTKNLQIPVTNELYYFFERLAHADDRKLTDYMYLILSTGLTFKYVEDNFYVKKLPHEYTEKDLKQIELNKHLEKNTEGWRQKDYDERHALGYEHVSDYWDEPKLDQIEKELRSFILDPSPLERDDKENGKSEGKRIVKKYPKK